MKEWKEKGSRDTAVRSEHSDVAKASVCVRSATTVCQEDTLIIVWVCRHVCTRNTHPSHSLKQTRVHWLMSSLDKLGKVLFNKNSLDRQTERDGMLKSRQHH